MKKLFLLISVSLFTFSSAQVVQLLDSNSNQNVNFEVVKNTTGVFVDGVVYRKKDDKIYKLVSDGVLDVKLFGAKGDGITDDTFAIQKAFDFLFKLKGDSEKLSNLQYSTIKLSAGKYRVTSTLYFPTGFTLLGNGKHFSTIFYDKLQGNALEVRERRTRANAYDHTNFTMLKDFTLTGLNSKKDFSYFPAAPELSNNGIYLFQVLKVKLYDVEISYFENAGLLIDSIYYTNVFGCYIHKNRIGVASQATSAMVGMNVNTSLTVDNTEIRQNSVGMWLKDIYGSTVTNSMIEENINFYNGQVFDTQSGQPNDQNSLGVILENSSYMKFNNNYFESQNCTFYLKNSSKNSIQDNLIVVGDVFHPMNQINPQTGINYELFSFAFYLGSERNKITNNGLLTGIFGNVPWLMVFDSTSKINTIQFLELNFYNSFLNSYAETYILNQNVGVQVDNSVIYANW